MSKRRLFGGGSDDDAAQEEAPVANTQDQSTAAQPATAAETGLDQPGVTGNEPSAATLAAGTPAADQKTNAELTAERDKELLKSAPQYVQDAAAQGDGSVPLAAPKGGEGIRVTVSTASSVPTDLQPPPPPAEYRAAPSAPGDGDTEARDKTSLGYEDATKATRLSVRTRDPQSAPIMVGGVYVTREGSVVEVSQVRARGGRTDSHLHALLSDPRVEVTRVDDA
jgi:hypothetical protein